MDSEKTVNIVGEVLGKIYGHWFRDLIFFVAIACEVFASQFIFPTDSSVSFTLSNLLVMVGLSIYWYSLCIAFGIYFNICVAIFSMTLNLKGSMDLVHPFALVFSGLSLFLSAFLFYLLSLFGYCFHLRFCSFIFAHILLYLIMRLARKRLWKFLSLSLKQKPKQDEQK